MRQRIHDGPVTEAGAALACAADAAVRLGVAAGERARFLADVARALRDHHPGGTIELSAEDRRLTAVIRAGTPPERTLTLAAAGTGPRPVDGTPAQGGIALLDHLVELQTLVEWSQKELEQTNKGIVALHAELAENTERLRSLTVPRYASAVTVWLVRGSGPLEPYPAVPATADGLIERRDAGLDHGIERLVAAFRSAEGELDHIADAVLDAMLSDSVREDDTCLLIFRALPDPVAGTGLGVVPVPGCRDGVVEV
jgi:hypothetical protein